jgi:membrane protein YqaA with SNARE-associated domain
MVYLYLFFIALGSATLLPGGSEALLLYLNSEKNSTLLLLFVATLGNTLGSFVNYMLGRYASAWAEKKNYIKSLHVKKSKEYFDRFGGFALLFAWVPLIGDPITFVAGMLRYNLLVFTVLVTLSKFSRYAFLLYIFNTYSP